MRIIDFADTSCDLQVFCWLVKMEIDSLANLVCWGKNKKRKAFFLNCFWSHMTECFQTTKLERDSKTNWQFFKSRSKNYNTKYLLYYHENQTISKWIFWSMKLGSQKYKIMGSIFQRVARCGIKSAKSCICLGTIKTIESFSFIPNLLFFPFFRQQTSPWRRRKKKKNNLIFLETHPALDVKLWLG